MGTLARTIASATVAVMVLALLADDADARRRRRSGLGPSLQPGQTATAPTLSREQLGFCLRLQSSLDAKTAQLHQDQEFIDDYRLMVDRRDTNDVAFLNVLIAKYNELVRTTDVEIGHFNEHCAGRAYYATDLAAVREAATKPPSATQAPPMQFPGTAVGTCKSDSALPLWSSLCASEPAAPPR